MLLRPQKVPHAPDLHVPLRQQVARTQVGEVGDGGEALLRGLGEAGRVEEVGVGLQVLPPHPAPELVQGGEAQPVRPLYEDGVGLGHVQARLNDGGGEEDVVGPLGEEEHGLLNEALGHLAVDHPDAGLGDEPFQEAPPGLYGGHPVVDVEDLAPTLQLKEDGLPHEKRVKGSEEGPDGLAARGRGLDAGEVLQAHQGGVEGAGDGGGGEVEGVHLRLELPDPLLLGHAEAVLLVHDEEAEVLKAHVRLKKAVGADDEVHGALGKALQDGLLLLGWGEAGEDLHPHGKPLEALPKGLPVLLGEEGGGHEEGHLGPVPHHPVGGP